MSTEHIARFSARIGSIAVTPRGFGTPLLVGYHTNFPEIVKNYSGSSSDILAALTTDGFAVGSTIYDMARVMLAQDRAPRTIKVARMDKAHSQSVVFTPKNLVEGSVYNVAVTLDGTTETASYTVENADTATDIATGLHTAVNAFTTVGVTSTDGTGSFTLAADTAGDTFQALVTVNGRVGDPADMDLQDDTALPTDYADRLAEILEADSDWYFLLSEINSDAIGNAIGDFIATTDKFYFGTTSDSDATESGTSTDLMSDMVADLNDRAAVTWDGKYNGFVNAALVGARAPTTPGSVSWSDVILRQVTVPDISPTLLNNLDTKKYTFVRPVSATLSGTRGAHVGGTYAKIDVTRGLDWLKVRSSEALTNQILSADKVPFTVEGLATIRATLQEVVNLAVSNGLLSPGEPNNPKNPPPAIFIPEITSVSTADKTARILRGVQISGILAGAIEQVIGDIIVEF